MLLCGNCGAKTSHIRITESGEICDKCSNLSPFLKLRPGFLTRNSFRVRSQQDKYAVDMLPPHRYNKSSKKVELAPEFIKHYPDKAHLYFKEGELKKAGFPKLAKAMTKQKEGIKKHKENLRAV